MFVIFVNDFFDFFVAFSAVFIGIQNTISFDVG